MSAQPTLGNHWIFVRWLRFAKMAIAVSPCRANMPPAGARGPPGRTGSALVRSHNVKQRSSGSTSRSRGALRPGLCQSLPPDEGWAERRQAPGCSGIRWTCHNAARRGACEAPLRPMTRDARLSALHHGDFGSGSRASISGISSRAVQRSSSQPGRSAWRAGFPNLPRILVTSQHPRNAIPCSAFRIVSRKRPS
jgi:hypothetical protein